MTAARMLPITVSNVDGHGISDQQALDIAIAEEVALSNRVNAGHVDSQVFRGTAGRQWFATHRPNGRHDDCDNPARCVHHHDQALAEIEHGGVLIVLHYTLEDRT